MKPTYRNGYSPVAGEWYPVFEVPRPAVYHEEVKQDIIGTLYPDLVTEQAKSYDDIATALEKSIDKTADVKLTADASIGLDEEGYVYTTFINKGETLNFDLNGHDFTCYCYAFYVNGGTLNIRDSKGTGHIYVTAAAGGLPTLYAEGDTAVINMYGGTIDLVKKADLTEVDDGHSHIYGVYCAKGAQFNMFGGTIHTDLCAGISVSNTDYGGGFADGDKWTGVGNFHITGDAHLIADNGAAVYQASMDYVKVDGNAVIEGGIIARMGHITVGGNAKVINNGYTDEAVYESLGDYVTYGSGTDTIDYGFLGMCGSFTTKDGVNDLTFDLKDNGSVKSSKGEDVVIAKMETNYDQDVTVTINNKDTTWKVFEYDDLSELTKNNKTKRSMPAKKSTVNCTVTVAGEKVYPVETTEDSSTDTSSDTTTTE